MVKQEMISGPFQLFFDRHHVEPRVKLHVPREKSYPFPLKCFDVTRAPNTSLDVLLGNILTITGTLMEIENCETCGQVPQDSLFLMKNHWMDIHGRCGD